MKIKPRRFRSRPVTVSHGDNSGRLRLITAKHLTLKEPQIDTDKLKSGFNGDFFPLDIFYADAKIQGVSGSVHKHLHRVIYGECTVGNHVYYSRYLDMLEGARGEFFRHLGCPLLPMQEAGTAFPVIGLQISYKGAARYDDLLTIELCVNEMGGIRLNFGFRILSAGGTLLAEGETRHVCASTDEKPKRLPKELVEKLQPFLHAPTHVP